MADSLRPLGYSHDATALEEELKALFVKLYADSLQATSDDINVYGAPHNGSFELVERNIEIEGLSVMRKTGEDRIRYLFKAWRHRNPERGLYFLRLYLSALFGGYADVQQLWHDKVATYPNGVLTALEVTVNGYNLNDYFLTSRVRVDLDTDIVPSKILSSLRSSVAARLLLNVRIGKFLANGVGMAGVGASVNVARLSWMAAPGEAPLKVLGSLPEYVVGSDYAGRLSITGGRGLKSVVQAGGSQLPAATILRVDQASREVVIEWPKSSPVVTPISLTLKVTDGIGKEGFWTGTIDEQLVYLTSRPYPAEVVEPSIGITTAVVGFVHKVIVTDQEVVVEAATATPEIIGFVHKSMPTVSHEVLGPTVAPEIVGFLHKEVVRPAEVVDEAATATPSITGFVHRRHPSATVIEESTMVSPTITGFTHE